MASAQIVSGPEHPGNFVSSALQFKGNHWSSRNERLPSVTMVASYLDDDVSLSETVGDQISELVSGSQFLQHEMAFREIRGAARSSAKRKRRTVPVSQRSTYLLKCAGKIIGLPPTGFPNNPVTSYDMVAE